MTDLIYCGVAHDGRAARTAKIARAAQMCCRGVRYGAQPAATAQPSQGAFARLLAA